MPVRRRSESAIDHLSRRVRALRDERGWSQAQLAVRAELDRSYLAGIELGRRNPTLKALEKLASAFSLSLSDLFAE